jgi:hypothetical protein
MTTRRRHRRGHNRAPRAAGDAPVFEDVEARAARLGITVDRVLREYAWIAFADLRHIVEWTEEGFKIKPSSDLRRAEAAAIAEIIEGAGTGKPYRVKLYDKEAALNAIGRYLGMFPTKPAVHEKHTEDDGEDPREFIIRELDRIAAEEAKRSGGSGSQP